MLSRSHPIILFIDRSGFSVYQDTLANIARFNFTPDLVSSLDIINKDQFVSLVTTFIQINKIVGSSLAVILSDNVIYVKDLINPMQKSAPAQDLKADSNDDKEHKDEVQSFLENVPFEEVLAKVIKTENINRIVAVNKDLVMTIINAFVDKGSTIEAIIPSFMYGQNVNFTAGLTSDNLQVILGNVEILRLGNLLTDQEKVIFSQNLEGELNNPLIDETKKKPKNLRQYLLIGVFVILLVILTVVYFSSQTSQTPPKNSSTSVNEVNILPTVIPTSIQESITPTPITIDLKKINIKILHSVQFQAVAISLKNSLLGIGFQNVLDEVSEDSIPEKSSVALSPNIPADLRNNIITKIKEALPDASVLENQDSDSTVNILIGKS